VLELIERKAAGEEVAVQPMVEEREEVPDLMAALEQSLAAAKKGAAAKAPAKSGSNGAAPAKKPAAAKGAKKKPAAKKKPRAGARS
jgi:non-homologous end joining protein Ku